jgi:hypothetical protein
MGPRWRRRAPPTVCSIGHRTAIGILARTAAAARRAARLLFVQRLRRRIFDAAAHGRGAGASVPALTGVARRVRALADAQRRAAQAQRG